MPSRHALLAACMHVLLLLNYVVGEFIKNRNHQKAQYNRPNIFHSDIGPSLMKMIHKAESELKFYIYPLPESVSFSSIPTDYGCLPHFRAEYMIIDFLRSANFVTDNPEVADFFLIPHNISCLYAYAFENSPDIIKLYGSNKNLTVGTWIERFAVNRHLKVILNSVIHDYPFFNRSYGNDHMFITTYDNFPYDFPFVRSHLVRLMSLLSNATCLMNTGLVREKYHLIRNFGTRKEGRDMTIPPFYSWLPRSNNSYLLSNSRKFDSFFKGITTFERDGAVSHGIRPLLGMRQDDVKFRYFSSSLQASFTVSDSYFCLCPGGLAPWSVRLYDAIHHLCIPVILATGGTHPFETFLNWTSFSEEINTDLFFGNHELTKRMRSKFLMSMHVKADQHRKFVEDNRSHDVSYIYKKLQFISEASSWLHWQYLNSDGVVNKKSIWRLLILELWCRSLDYGQKSTHKSDNIIDRKTDILFCFKYKNLSPLYNSLHY